MTDRNQFTPPDEPVTQRIERALDRRELVHDKQVGDKFFAVLQQLLIPLILGLFSCLGGIIVVGLGMREDISILRHDYQGVQTALLTVQADMREIQKELNAIDKRMIKIEQQNRSDAADRTIK